MYRYEIHCHTSEVSACGQVTAEEQVRFYRDEGYDGIIITDHFLNGNTTVAREGISWEEKVDGLMRGYEAAREAGEKLGLKVFYGFEYGYLGTDLLTYGVGREWLLAHPDVDKMPVIEYLDTVRRDGGYVIHAHPFREASYLDQIRLFPRHVDAVEVINSDNSDFENARAMEYAEHYGLAVAAGTDNHIAGRTPRLSGVVSKKPLDSIEDFIQAMRDGALRIFDTYRTPSE